MTFLMWFGLYFLVGLILTLIAMAVVQWTGPKEWPETFRGWAMFLTLATLGWPVTVVCFLWGSYIYIEEVLWDKKYRKEMKGISNAKKRF